MSNFLAAVFMTYFELAIGWALWVILGDVRDYRELD